MSAIDVAAAERSVLGSAILSSRALEECIEVLQPDDFSAVVAEHLYAAMVSMHANGVAVDAVTLWDHVKSDPIVVRGGGAVLIHDLIANVPTASNVSHYATIVARESVRRRAVAALERSRQLLDNSGDPHEVLEVAANEILSSARVGSGTGWVGLSVDEWREELDRPVEYTATPWPALNALIRGWTPGKFYVLGARPAVGKSLVALQAAADLARHGAVSLSSLEMGRDEILDRIIADLSDVSLNSIQTRKFTDGEKLRIDAAIMQVRKMRLSIDDRTNISSLDIGSHARSVARREPLSGVVIDYLQLMAGSGQATRREEVAEASRQMKLLAKGMHVPVLVLSQLNRNLTNRDDSTPEMSDLKDSGSIEQDADVVLLLYRRMITDPETGEKFEHPTELTVRVAKNRSGRTGAFSLTMDGEFARVRNPAMRP